MADRIIGVVIGSVLNKVIELAAEKISLAWGVDEQLRKLADKLEMIQALLDDAQSKQLTSKVFQLWLNRLQLISLDAEIVLDDIRYEVLRKKIKCRKRDKLDAFFSSSNPLSVRLTVAHKIKYVLSSLELLLSEASDIGLTPLDYINSVPDMKDDRSTNPFVNDSKIVGRENDVSKMVSLLTSTNYEVELPVITILAMGGLGKTTLAQLIFKNDTVRRHFDKLAWVCVSDNFNVIRLLGEMLQSLTGTDHQLRSAEALVNELKEQLRNKNYLLVLDDVWNNKGDEWDHVMACLQEVGGFKNSRILATTRGEDVALAMRSSECHRLDRLSKEQSWELFEKCAFAKRCATSMPQFVDIGRRIVERCGGVPLAIEIIGCSLYSKNSEAEWSMIEKSEMWNVNSGGDRVLAAIKLSFDHLPSLSVKQCLAHCAIFQKDSILKKDQLLQFWMAHGLLNPPKGSLFEMEDIGIIYCNVLLRNSLFQVAEKDDDNNITAYKMHDLVHDISLKVLDDHCFHIEGPQVECKQVKAMHISIYSRDRMRNSLKCVFPSNLRTLYLKGIRFDLSEDFFENLTCLRVLIVEDRCASKLPDSIGKIKHLRFLDISATSITTLPKSFTELYLLQTLKVGRFQKLPEGFGNLISLRHLHMDVLPECPLIGLGQLKNIQTLSFFKVGEAEGSQIGELEHLDNLRELNILDLENVRSYESAAKSNLSNKLNIQTLKLRWSTIWGVRDDLDVMESLKPHSCLKILCIYGYQSPKFPSWMVIGKNDSFVLHNLVQLKLEWFFRSKTLPSLGGLPFLESVEIRKFPNVKCIGNEFYGLSNFDWETKYSSQNITMFPALRRLELCDMESLEEWSDAIGMIPTTHSSSIQVKLFPLLEKMVLRGLSNLKIFPNLGSLPNLQELVVEHCRNLTVSYVDWNIVLGSPHHLEIHDERQAHSPENDEDVGANKEIQYHFPSLREVKISGCDKFTAAFCSLISSSSLEYLNIDYCHHDSWPKDLHRQTNLKTLSLGATFLANDKQPDHLPWPYPTISSATSYSISLTSLELSAKGFEKVKSLPHQIQYATLLTYLCIDGFNGLDVLPEWLGKLELLQRLHISSCQRLKQLPSAEAMKHLINLHTLIIRFCPLLSSWFEGTYSEWVKKIPQQNPI